MARRITIKNPDGCTYRLPMINKENNIRIEMDMGYPTLFGSLVDIIGKLEDIMSLEDWMKKTKNKVHVSAKNMHQ